MAISHGTNMGAPDSLLSHHPFPKHQTILLVEDQPDRRRLLKHILEIKGDTCLEAANGREALPVIHQHPSIRLILSDYLMPGMDGQQVLQVFRPNPIKPAIPFIPVTGQISSGISPWVKGPLRSWLSPTSTQNSSTSSNKGIPLKPHDALPS